MLELRYGIGTLAVSGIIMSAYGLIISTTPTVAYSSIVHALLGIDRVPAILRGGSIVVIYSMLGAKWSVTLTDFVQFIIQTIGIFLIFFPVVLMQASGYSGLSTALWPEVFDSVGIGESTIPTYLITYTLGPLIGQNIWQRVFIGTAARTLVPGIEVSADVVVKQPSRCQGRGGDAGTAHKLGSVDGSANRQAASRVRLAEFGILITGPPASSRASWQRPPSRTTSSSRGCSSRSSVG